MESTLYRIPTHPGDVVKEELEARGISQKDFAARTGISYTMLNEILNAKRPMTSEVALAIINNPSKKLGHTKRNL